MRCKASRRRPCLRSTEGSPRGDLVTAAVKLLFEWFHGSPRRGASVQQPRQMPLIMRSSAAFSWLTGSFGFISFFSEGTWSARGWRCPTGASGKHLLVRVHRRRCGCISRASRRRNRRRTVDKGQQGYRRDQLSHNGSPSWDPPTAIMVRGSSIAKLRQASHFVQLLQRAGRKGGA